MADVHDFIQAVQQNLLAPLQQLPVAQLKALDTTHDQSVIDFQNAIGQLYAPPGPFAGKASAALADLLANYYAAENALSAYSSDGLSERVSKLIQFCQEVVSELEPKLKDLQGTDSLTMAAGTLATLETGAAAGPHETPAVPIVQLVIAGIVGSVVIGAQAWQEWKIWDVYDTMHRWEMNMSGLAAHPDPTLPTSPDLSRDVNVDVATINNLSPAQQQEVSDIIARLTAIGYAVNQWEIEELVKAGYGRDAIVAMIASLNDGTTNVYLKGQPGQNAVVDFFSALITFLTLEATSNLRFLRALYEGRKPGQGIRAAIPNDDQLPRSVRTWLLMSPQTRDTTRYSEPPLRTWLTSALNNCRIIRAGTDSMV